MAEGRTIVADVARAVGLTEGPSGVRAVVSALARLEPVSTRRLSRAAGLPVPIVASICGELRKRSVVAEERPSRLTDDGRRLFAGGALALDGGGTCRECAGRGVVVSSALDACVRDVAHAAKLAPPPRFDLDQCHCTVETKLRRVLALHEADALVGRRILVLGDDDATSLAIASVVRRLGSRETVAQMTVLDVDRDVVAFVRRGLAGAPFPYACVEHDLRRPLPGGLVGCFDVVVTDPPYTHHGARLFLSRAAEALDEGGTVLFSFGSRRLATTAAVQRDLASMGFAIQRLVPDFNAYVGAGVLAGTSNLYVLRATAGVRPLVTGEFAGSLYTAES
ncbi:MAG TPA: bis-aminopropyl spermidine synthase family protein [Gaiellaceae bacterium]|nr:bis-aminopropyl spermidine synthase family protein [Gaiellaceae bacterium]